MTNDDFREWRKRHKLSQERAAQLLGIGRTTLKYYERGQRPDREAVLIPQPVALACLALDMGDILMRTVGNPPAETSGDSVALSLDATLLSEMKAILNRLGECVS